MRRIIRSTDFLFLAVLIASGQGLPSARGPLRPVTQYLFCHASEPAGQGVRTLYYSSDFVLEGQNLRPMQDAFLAFLQQKYSFKGDPSTANQINCTGVQSVAESKSTLQVYLDRDRKDNRLKVIETGWTYGSAPVATAPTPSPAIAAVAPGAPAPQPHTFSPADISGVYNGSYQCTDPPHETEFKASLVVTPNTADTGDLTGVVTFEAQGGTGAQPATFSLIGSTAGAAFSSHFVKWETTAPTQSIIMGGAAFDVNTSFGLNGSYNPNSEISGFIVAVVNPACKFSAKRDDAETATITAVIAAQKAGQAALATPASGPAPAGRAVAVPAPGQTSQIPGPTPPTIQRVDQVAPVQPAPAPDAAGTPPMRDLSQRYTLLLRQAEQGKAALGQLEQRLASQGLGLRSDAIAARTRLDTQLQAANEAIGRGDASQAEESLRFAEAALETIQKILGR